MVSLGNKNCSRSNFYKITILTQPLKGGPRQDLSTKIFEFIGEFGWILHDQPFSSRK